MFDYPPDRWCPTQDEDSVLMLTSQPVSGLMSPYIGHQYTVDEVWEHHRNHVEVHPQEDAALRPLAQRIRAFDIPTVAGAAFTVARLNEASKAFHALLLGRLPGIPWEPTDVLSGRAKKYAIFHEVVPAPLDEASHEAMVLEIFGRAESMGGQPLPRGWFTPFRQANTAEEDAVDLGEIVFRIERGTYANTRFPGIGVPFYM